VVQSDITANHLVTLNLVSTAASPLGDYYRQRPCPAHVLTLLAGPAGFLSLGVDHTGRTSISM
jgi:hypothetical protein